MRWLPLPLPPAVAEGGGGGFGYHHHWGHGFGIGYIGGVDDGCYVTRPVLTPFGYRLRTINVCGY
ncbi:hypothetical protein [Bradyrhizobium sp.]|uniref:hypothetical protein n=1 Tax=Bradyrhizobium sp. TaxID=376 RepID=UPI003BAE6A22